MSSRTHIVAAIIVILTLGIPGIVYKLAQGSREPIGEPFQTWWILMGGRSLIDDTDSESIRAEPGAIIWELSGDRFIISGLYSNPDPIPYRVLRRDDMQASLRLNEACYGATIMDLTRNEDGLLVHLGDREFHLIDYDEALVAAAQKRKQAQEQAADVTITEQPLQGTLNGKHWRAGTFSIRRGFDDIDQIDIAIYPAIDSETDIQTASYYLIVRAPRADGDYDLSRQDTKVQFQAMDKAGTFVHLFYGHIVVQSASEDSCRIGIHALSFADDATLHGFIDCQPQDQGTSVPDAIKKSNNISAD